jgi:hypothetical protein
MRHTPKTFACPHCGNVILNACEQAILSCVEVKNGLSWGELREKTKLSSGALSEHLNLLIDAGKGKPVLFDRQVLYFLEDS